MLTLNGKSSADFCDGVSRRQFLSVGALGLGGLCLPDLLRAEAAAKTGSSHKSVIMIFLPGGPSHQDMWDLKMDAPSEIRGEFKPISTNVPGIQICELFPQLAKISDKLTYIRSMVGCHGGHDAVQCLTGRTPRNMPQGGWPSLGAALSRLEGPVNEAMPPFLGLAPKCGHDEWGDCGTPGFLGPSHSPFKPFRGASQGDMTPNGVTVERMDDRKSLLNGFDRLRRDVDRNGMMEGLDTFNRQAFGILTSSRLAQALDLSREDPKVVERYGKGTEKLTADGAWKRLDQFLMARRLVEAGARCVTLSFSRWDWHGDNFGRARTDFPMLDQGVSALVEDLHQRGMDKDVSVVVWGEFGRTPQINANAGRDHWPRVSCALLAGGGMNHGQVIGSTDRLGGEAVDRPVGFGDVFATLYRALGINTDTTTVNDLTGRPQYLVDRDCRALPELVG